MHPIFSSNVPGFLVKLWKLVSDPTTDDLITWSHSGSSFIIVDPDRFAKELLPQYFKHNNNASFIRQLNIYGFRKVMNYEKVNSYKEEVEFQHAFFLKDKVELLTNIKRKNSATKATEPDVSFSANDILSNLSTLREKQRVMDTTLTKMKKENEVLWRELSTVRQRHKAREQVLHKVIQFLVQLIQRSNQSIHVPRKLARMLQNSSVSQENSSQVARIVEVLRNNDSDCVFVPDETSNPLGAVIHEVTDFDSSPNNDLPSPINVKFNTSILKPKPSTSKNTLSLNSSNNASLSSLDHLNILENVQNRTIPNLEGATCTDTTTNNLPVKYVAVPVQGNPNQLILIPADNFTNQEILTLKPDSVCNVIPLPEKETTNPNLKSISDTSTSVNSIISNSIKNKYNKNSKIQESSAPGKTGLNNLHSITNDVCSQNSDESVLTKEIDDSSLSDLLKASKISSVEDEHEQSVSGELNCETNSNGSLFDKESLDVLNSIESCNNQVAIPGPSSLIKSTKSCFPDLNSLQESNSTSNIDMKLLEQLLGSDDTAFNEPNAAKLPNDVNMSNPSDDIIGNELVQFTPSMFEDEDQLPWFDFLNQESYFNDSEMNSDFFCAPKDTDVLLGSSSDSCSSSIGTFQKEPVLFAPKENTNSADGRTKRRKVN